VDLGLILKEELNSNI